MQSLCRDRTSAHHRITWGAGDWKVWDARPSPAHTLTRGFPNCRCLKASNSHPAGRPDRTGAGAGGYATGRGVHRQGIEDRLAARQDRQRMLRERQNTAFSFILDEHMFKRCTGGPEITRELIDQILELGSLRNVEIQLLPLSRGVHAGLNGPMMLLETPQNQWYGYIEGQETGQLISDPKTISVLQMRYAKLRSQALTPEDSASLLKQLRGAL
ncbi:DUF5753 domain-containing protein [Streptomyces ureilyticus]|nr:DUF5753 domain-containing protein [Streptomyces ureilyticus]